MTAELGKVASKILQLIRRRTQEGLPTSLTNIGGHCGHAGFWCRPGQCDFYIVPDRAAIQSGLQQLEARGLIYHKGHSLQGFAEWYAI